MYTCYPFDELGLTNDRFYVYAEYVSGPQVKSDEQGGN
jgi:sortase A